MTSREEDMMDLLWDSGKPMTSVDMEQALSDKDWNHAAIFRVIKSLKEKGLIEECGTQLRGKQWTRLFQPVVDREEYMAQYLVEHGIKSRSLGLVAMAVVDKSEKSESDDEQLIQELERIIQRIKERGKGAD